MMSIALRPVEAASQSIRQSASERASQPIVVNHCALCASLCALPILTALLGACVQLLRT